jgi:hypothetical protein
MTMTDRDMHDQAIAEAQRARVEALRQRRAPRVDPSASPAVATGPAPGRKRRRRAAVGSRVGVAAVSVATMFGLVGVMGLARPASSATPTVPHGTTATPSPVPVPTSAPAPASTATPGQAVAAPPVALTARPSVQVTTPTTAAPAARTNGSH